MEEKKVHCHDGACDCAECSDACENEEIFEFESEDGKVLKFVHIGTIEHNSKYYAGFQIAEPTDEISDEEIFIYEVVDIDAENSDLVPIEDQALLDEVFDAFCTALEGDEECDCEDDCDCDK